MQLNVTLSNKEKRYYFFYLLAMLLGAVLLISAVTLYRFDSPFTSAEIAAVQQLQEKSKFEARQEMSQDLLDSTFTKIDRLEVKDLNPDQLELENSITDVATVMDQTNIIDQRKLSYRQISNFYKMYLDDKIRLSSQLENIESYKKQFDDCSANVSEKKQMMLQRENAQMMSR